jgi:hypothetical protein
MLPPLPGAHVPQPQRGQTRKVVAQTVDEPLPRKKPAQRASTTDAESSTDAGRNAVMPKGGSNLALLPPILSASRTRYFATLLSALFSSSKPFDDFQKFSPAFLQTCHTAFESVWPCLKIKVETDDVLFNIVSGLLYLNVMALIWCAGLSTSD